MLLRFKGLPAEQFQKLFDLGDAALQERNIRRMVADTRPGFPCRISLEDAEPGESVLLLAYRHQPAASPYASSGPIFVREQARKPYDGPAVPSVLRNRALSVRAYDSHGMMVDADVVDGNAVEPVLERLLARQDARYAHIHNAKRGCYACYVERG